MSTAPREAVPLRAQAAVYGAGLFSFSMAAMASTVVPLWVAQLTGEVGLMGLAMGARHFLTLMLSIHGGVLMDRLGTRRVMIAFGLAGMTAPLLFPMASSIWVLILLQMVAGLADAMVWMGAQALSGRIMQGNPTYVGRMTSIVRFGSFLSPVVVGAAWDLFGVWGAFVSMSLWSSMGFVSVLLIPAPRDAAAAARSRVRVGARDLVPRLADYIDAFRLAAIPAVALVLLVSIVRVGGTGMQGSFYVVYVEGLGISATQIGLLIGMAGLCASLGSLFAGSAARAVPSHWVVVLAVTLTTLTIASTPLLGGVYAVLLLVLGIRGLCLGISQPLEISIVGRALARDLQGRGVGLRTTLNRLAHSFVPVGMGLIAELVGLENSFYLTGALLLAVIAAAALFTGRSPALGRD